MKYFTAAIATVALSVALVGCGANSKSETKTSTSAATSTSTKTVTSSGTSTAPAAGAKYTIADYIKDNKITETPVHHGDPGSPTIDLPVPDGWQLLKESSSAPYGGIVLAQPADPSDPPTIVALVAKLTGNIDQAKLIQYAPGELQNLPGYQGSGNGNVSTLGGFAAWQLGGTYDKNGKRRAIAQKTVVIPSGDAVFVLQLNADSLESEQGPLMDATNVIDEQTTITL
jgi:Probable lipoprotein LpqN